MKKLIDLVKNKFFLASTAFIVWMLFFDKNDVNSQFEYRSQVNKLEAEKDFYTKEIKTAESDLQELTTNPEKLEKFARERYFMKKDNEDVFIIVEVQKPKEDDSFF
jgi:cell division protein FtsB